MNAHATRTTATNDNGPSTPAKSEAAPSAGTRMLGWMSPSPTPSAAATRCHHRAPSTPPTARSTRRERASVKTDEVMSHTDSTPSSSATWFW